MEKRKMEKKKYIFIINPNANQGRNREVKRRIEQVCTKMNLSYEIRFTYRVGAATKIAKEYEKEEAIIYAVGGDGLINEVLNGIMGTNNRLGVIPAGSGNDFYRTIQNSISETRRIDVGKINHRYYLNVACVGLDGDAGSNVYRMKKLGIPKKWLYTSSVIYTFIHYKAPEVTLKIGDKQITDKLSMLAICNGKYYGGGYLVAPRAKLADGLLDIYFVGNFPKIRFPKYILKIKKGKHELCKPFQKFQAKEVEITSKKKIRFVLDGEMMSGTHFKVRIIPEAVILYRNPELEEKIKEEK